MMERVDSRRPKMYKMWKGQKKRQMKTTLQTQKGSKGNNDDHAKMCKETKKENSSDVTVSRRLNYVCQDNTTSMSRTTTPFSLGHFSAHSISQNIRTSLTAPSTSFQNNNNNIPTIIVVRFALCLFCPFRAAIIIPMRISNACVYETNSCLLLDGSSLDQTNLQVTSRDIFMSNFLHWAYTIPFK